MTEQMEKVVADEGDAELQEGGVEEDDCPVARKDAWAAAWGHQSQL